MRSATSSRIPSRSPRRARRHSRIGAELAWPSVAADDRGRPPRGRDRAAAPGADPDRRARAHVRADGSPADAGRRRRDHPARERRDPELGDRVLRRRRRPARRRRARAQRAHAEPANGRPSSTARSPSSSSPPGRRAPGCATSWATTGAGSTSRIVGDHVGRTIWALGEILSTAWVPAVVGPVPARCSTRSCRRSRGDVSLRTAAYAVLGLARLDPDRLDRRRAAAARAPRRPARHGLPRLGVGRVAVVRGRLTYDNARLPQALIVGGAALDGDRTTSRSGSSRSHGSATSAASTTACSGLPGHHGRDRDEPAPGEGDEQPLDAAALVEAELAALVVTGEVEHGSRARSAFDWFLGRNRLDRPLYDFATGGCSDGLGERRPERERGRGVDARLPSRPAAPRRRGAAGRRPAPQGSREGRVMAEPRELFRRHPATPS